MSKFFTPIAVDIKAVTKLLPLGAFVESIRWNARKDQVEIVWDHGPYFTGLDFPMTFELELLKEGRTPKLIARKVKPLINANQDPAADARTLAGKAVAGRKGSARK